MKLSQILLEGVQILIDDALKKQTKIYDGIISAVNSDGTYSVSISGKTLTLTKYTSGAVAVNTKVKIFVPQGNLSLAFIM